MAVQSAFYLTDGTTRTFPSTKHIASKLNVGVYAKLVTTDAWVAVNSTTYVLSNNSIVFNVAPDAVIYSQIEIRVADTSVELVDSPSNISIVAGAIANVNTVATDITNVNTVATNIGSITAVSSNLATVTNVSTNIANVNTVSSHIANVDTVATNTANINAVVADIVNIDTVAGDITNVHILGQAIASGTVGGTGGGGQFVGNSTIKGIQFMAQTTNEALVIPAGTNAFSVGTLTLINGASITVPNGSDYKIL